VSVGVDFVTKFFPLHFRFRFFPLWR
jgi:hypothetical protein